MKNLTFSVVDLETTGHSSKSGDRIIQIAIVQIQNDTIVRTYNTFVQPDRPIPPFIAQLTTINDETVAEAPRFEEIAEHVRDLLDDTVFVAHNVQFDEPFLRHEMDRVGVDPWYGPTLDTVELVKIAYPTASSYRLQDIAETLDIPLAKAHRADEDALATAHVLMRAMDRLRQLPEETIRLLHKRSFTLKSDLSRLFYLLLQERAGTEPDAMYNGIPIRALRDVQSTRVTTMDYPADFEEKYEWLQRINPHYERRAVQFRYMDAVWQALREEREVALEVPTGVGKTLGYLLPGIVRSLQRGAPLVISTYTNHLVDSIVERELPKVEKMIGRPLATTVIKGREHYISLSRFEQLLLTTDESYDETLTIMQLLVWLTETTTGDLSQVNVSGGGQLLLKRIQRKGEVVSEVEKPYDFYERLLEQIPSSDVVVTNHSLLMTNRLQEALDQTSGLIIDEAHQMIPVALRTYETSFSYTSWKYVIGQFVGEGAHDLLPELVRIRNGIDRRGDVLRHQLLHAHEQFMRCFDEAVEQLIEFVMSESSPASTERSCLLQPEQLALPLFNRVGTTSYTFLAQAAAFTDRLHRVHFASKRDEAFVEQWNDWVEEARQKLDEWIDLFSPISTRQHSVYATVDVRSLPGSLHVWKRAIKSAPLLREFVRRSMNERVGIVWTSGTMVAPGNDRFIIDQIGLSERVAVQTFEAPASFYEGANVCIVSDMPDIQSSTKETYVEAVVDAVVQAAYATKGRMFVLFTSKQMLRQAYDLLTDADLLPDYQLLAQGITGGSRTKLLKNFKQLERSILFGTNSFWEGVDIPGEALSAVLVVRLPFSSPLDPFYQARTRGERDPFQTLGLPEAILRFRQGFGRLIRATDDRGFFIVLDRRIETKSYGVQFLKALPNVAVHRVSIESLMQTMEELLAKN